MSICVDFRGINKDIIPDRYPIPRIDDLIDIVGRQQGKLLPISLYAVRTNKCSHNILMLDESII